MLRCLRVNAPAFDDQLLSSEVSYVSGTVILIKIKSIKVHEVRYKKSVSGNYLQFNENPQYNVCSRIKFRNKVRLRQTGLSPAKKKKRLES